MLEALLAILAASAADAPVNRYMTASPTDEYQIAWKLGPSPTKPGGWVQKNNEVVRTRMLPERLFVAAADVRSASGELLVPKGMQLLGMDFSRPLVCSVAKGPAASRAASKRVCLLDEDGDGDFDSWFDRVMGRSTFRSDGFWFIMNQTLDANRAPLAPVTLTAVPSDQFDQKLDFELRYQSISDRSRVTTFSVKVGGSFYILPCGAYIPEGPASAAALSGCEVAGVTMNLAGRRKDELLIRLAGDFADQRVRFGAWQGLIGRQPTEIRFPDS